MNRILILLKLALAVVPAYVLGYAYRSAFRHLPEGFYYLLVLVPILAAGIYLIRKQRNGYAEREEIDYMPEWLSGNSIYVYLIIGTLAGSFMASSTNRTVLYVDNGSDQPIKVSVKHEEEFEVAPRSHHQTSVSLGENEIEWGGKSKAFNFNESGNWVVNINKLNRYVETDVDYSNQEVLYKNGVSMDSTKSTLTLIQEEFFKTKADFMFTAPEKIAVKKSSAGESVKKLVLLRMPTNN